MHNTGMHEHALSHDPQALELASVAARWVVEEGLRPSEAKQRAAEHLGLRGRVRWPDEATMDAAVRDTKGQLDDKDAVRAALKKASFKSVRGDFRFGNNQFPVQDFVLRVVRKGHGLTLENSSSQLTLEDLKPVLDVWARDARDFQPGPR